MNAVFASGLARGSAFVIGCLTLLTEPPQAALDAGVYSGTESYRHLKAL